MPIHLPPMTRRRFLARTIGAGAALVLPAAARGAETADPNRFALLSDTHIPSDPKVTSRGVNMVDHLRRAVAEVAALDGPVAGAIVSGDLAHLVGKKEDYRQLAPLLRKLTGAKVPVHLALGNHDHRQNFAAVLTDHKQAAPPLVGRYVSVVEAPRANWFLLDSLDKTNTTPGLLGAEQRVWLAAALDARKDKPAIVVDHHDPYKPPAPAKGKPARKTSGLRDVDELFELLVPRKHVKAFVFGHRHRWARGQREGIHLIDVPTTAYVFGKSQPSAWVLAQLQTDGIRLELRSLDGKHADHGKKIDLPWRS